jgi:hypothetical protein
MKIRSGVNARSDIGTDVSDKSFIVWEFGREQLL